VGFCLLVAMLVWSRPRIALAATAVVGVCYAGLTLHQSANWKDEPTLFTHSYLIANTNWTAQRNYAFALGRSGRCAEALPMLASFVSQDPTDAKATFALGSCYFHRNYFEEAERMMRLTAWLDPHYQQPFLMIAAMRLQQGRIAEAEEAWEQARQAQ